MRHIKYFEGFLGKPSDENCNILYENDEIILTKDHSLSENKIGFITYRFDEFQNEKALNIVFIILNNDKRSKGYGGKIMHILNILAKENNCKYMHLEVLQSNKNAYNFYIKHGFKKYDYELSFDLLYKEII